MIIKTCFDILLLDYLILCNRYNPIIMWYIADQFFTLYAAKYFLFTLSLFFSNSNIGLTISLDDKISFNSQISFKIREKYSFKKKNQYILQQYKTSVPNTSSTKIGLLCLMGNSTVHISGCRRQFLFLHNFFR